MKMLIKEVEGDGYVSNRARRLSFKEFCQYVYEPKQRIKALNLSEEEEFRLRDMLEARKTTLVN